MSEAGPDSGPHGVAVEPSQDVQAPPQPAPERPGKAARNERRKAAATTLNGLSAGLLIAVVIQATTGQLAA